MSFIPFQSTSDFPEDYESFPILICIQWFFKKKSGEIEKRLKAYSVITAECHFISTMQEYVSYRKVRNFLILQSCCIIYGAGLEELT